MKNWQNVLSNINLTAKQIAKHCGVSQRTVEGWRQGRTPSGSAIKHLQTLRKLKKGSPNVF